MCLTLPGRVVSIAGDGSAVVARGDQRLTVSLLAAAAGVSVGDWVLVHSGFVLERLTDDDVQALAALGTDGDRT